MFSAGLTVLSIIGVGLLHNEVLPLVGWRGRWQPSRWRSPPGLRHESRPAGAVGSRCPTCARTSQRSWLAVAAPGPSPGRRRHGRRHRDRGSDPAQQRGERSGGSARCRDGRPGPGRPGDRAAEERRLGQRASLPVRVGDAARDVAARLVRHRSRHPARVLRLRAHPPRRPVAVQQLPGPLQRVPEREPAAHGAGQPHRAGWTRAVQGGLPAAVRGRAGGHLPVQPPPGGSASCAAQCGLRRRLSHLLQRHAVPGASGGGLLLRRAAHGGGRPGRVVVAAPGRPGGQPGRRRRALALLHGVLPGRNAAPGSGPPRAGGSQQAAAVPDTASPSALSVRCAGPPTWRGCPPGGAGGRRHRRDDLGLDGTHHPQRRTSPGGCPGLAGRRRRWQGVVGRVGASVLPVPRQSGAAAGEARPVRPPDVPGHRGGSCCRGAAARGQGRAPPAVRPGLDGPAHGDRVVAVEERGRAGDRQRGHPRSGRKAPPGPARRGNRCHLAASRGRRGGCPPSCACSRSRRSAGWCCWSCSRGCRPSTGS